MYEPILPARLAEVEHWLPVVGFDGYYEISTIGRLRSLRHMTSIGWRGGKIIAKKRMPTGYIQYSLSVKGEITWCYGHRLVAGAFIGPCPEGMEVCHKDDVRCNNVLSNLFYDTHEHNQQQISAHGRNFNANKTHCVNGHEFTEDNTRISIQENGIIRRHCRACGLDSQRRSRRQTGSGRVPGSAAASLYRINCHSCGQEFVGASSENYCSEACGATAGRRPEQLALM